MLFCKGVFTDRNNSWKNRSLGFIAYVNDV